MNNIRLFNNEGGKCGIEERKGDLELGVRFQAGHWPGASCVIVHSWFSVGFTFFYQLNG